MPDNKRWIIVDVPDGSSVLAQAALDILTDGSTPFTMGNGWDLPEFQTYAASKIQVLVDLLRSDEPLPSVLRLALAEAIDPNADSPISLTMKRRGNSARIAVLWRNLALQQQVLPIYESLRAAGANALEALAFTARQVGAAEDVVKVMLRDARAERRKNEHIEQLMAEGRSIEEIAVAIKSAPPKAKRGRPSKKEV